jgi:hypothetical protein
LLVITEISIAQENSRSEDSNFEFLPSSNLFEPVKASILEAKNGIIKDISKNNLQLNIGISADLCKWIINNQSISIGADFFTYSGLRSESNFKFPVDAIDYFFGVNFNYKKLFGQNSLIGRLRVSHISAHLEDGHIYSRSDTIFTPFVFSREFVDLSCGYDYWLLKYFKLKNIISVNILFHSIPNDFGILSLQYGFEFRYFLGSYFSVYISNELKLQNVSNENYLNENLETGIRFGKINSRGFSLSFNYYDGRDYKGQYYKNYLNYKAIGFNVDI